MRKIFQRLLNSQKGQTLPIVLCVLAIGGLTVAANLNYATTSLNGSRITAEKSEAVYAAEAGVEDTLWRLAHYLTPQSQLGDSLNHMTVNLQTQNTGVYTLYLGELIEPGEHFDFLAVEWELVWDSGAGAYKYTVSVTLLETDSTVHLSEVGARLPPGFSYQAGSAAGFPNNLSNNEPSQTLDTAGAVMLRWVFSNPLPELKQSNPTATQTFYITGGENPEGEYAWVVANRTDIGVVGVTGGRYIITAEARRQEDNRIRARIKADVIMIDTEDEPYIVSWQVSD
jgi:hypothetical protein